MQRPALGIALNNCLIRGLVLALGMKRSSLDNMSLDITVCPSGGDVGHRGPRTAQPGRDLIMLVGSIPWGEHAAG